MFLFHLTFAIKINTWESLKLLYAMKRENTGRKKLILFPVSG
jgi:hypothetical protein